MNGQKPRCRSRMETRRLCCLFGVGLSLFVLISCVHQKTYFGIANESSGNPLFGYYKCGQFIPAKLGEDVEQYFQDVNSFIASFPVNEVFTGVMADGREIKVQIKSKKECLLGMGDNFFQLEIWHAGRTILPMTEVLFWTPNIKVKFLKSIDVRLDEAALKQIQSEALRLWKEALEKLPEDDEMRTLSRIELLSPTIQKVEGAEEVVTVLNPTLIKTSASFVENGIKHEFEHVNDGTSIFFIYSVSERKIVFGSFGNLGWDSHAIRMVTVKPLIYFRILGDSSVYFLGEHSLGWEHFGYAIFNLKLGKVLLWSY